MDAHERLVFDSEIAAAVLGRAGEFTLFTLTDGPLDPAALEEAARRGYKYAGVLAVVNGKANARCEPNPDAAVTMLYASLAFAQQVADRLTPMDDSEQWLWRLWSLTDPRLDA